MLGALRRRGYRLVFQMEADVLPIRPFWLDALKLSLAARLAADNHVWQLGSRDLLCDLRRAAFRRGGMGSLTA